MGGERSLMPQHAILRFAKHKAGPAGALEAHHERTKERYASNPDIDITRSKDNFHIIQPHEKYRREIDSRIKSAGCRTRKDSTMFVDTLITASPKFFKGRSKKDIQVFIWFVSSIYISSIQQMQSNVSYLPYDSL
jgi:hypothetical protein